MQKLEPTSASLYGLAMQRLALALALGGFAAVLVRAPGPYVALALAIGAIGTGIVGYRRRSAPGARRLLAAGAVTVGCLVLVLATARVALTLAAIGHVAEMLPAQTTT